MTSELLFRVFARTTVVNYSRSHKKICEQEVNHVYRYLQSLCDILEDNISNEIQGLNPLSISMNESSQILQGVR